MKINILNLILCSLVLCTFSCTDEFEETNINPYQISDDALKADFKHVGSKVQPILLETVLGQGVGTHQIGQNLCSDSWVRYLATATPFVGGVNNTTYKMTWKSVYWNQVYGSLMGPANILIDLAKQDKLEVFVELANLIKIMGISRLTTLHGPVIYSDFGSTTGDVNYDKEEDLYPLLFKDLDRIHATFSKNLEYETLQKFDLTPYKGNIPQWLKFINSLRLRLAIRIANIAPELAKKEGEKAIKDDKGLILETKDNLEVFLSGLDHPLKTIANSWLDTRMSASMESILCGYDDPRISKFFAEATDESLQFVNHPNLKYKGVRNGATLDKKATRTPFSSLGPYLAEQAKHIQYLVAPEVYFCLAEAKLRGWDAPQTAEEYYNRGIEESFAQWGAGSAETYIANDTKIPLDYEDEKVADINDFKNKITVTVKWDETADKETKLERIITQKWIANFPDSFEPWADFRRTGYPKLPVNAKNDSFEEEGLIAKDDFIKRKQFPINERNNNKKAVEEASKWLPGGDKISSRLWWDTGKPNF